MVGGNTFAQSAMKISNLLSKTFSPFLFAAMSFTSFGESTSELFSCKEQLIVEMALKNEAIKQKIASQLLVHVKSQNNHTLECRRLQERNIALAMELAALKLVCDVNLGEEEVLKLASLGNEANNKETIDVLKKSLVISNRSYKELMTKCNILGRGEARSLGKLEMAQGPDGTTTHLGKWCKKVQNKGSAGLQGSDANSGDLISVGADGRGGSIKVLRSINQASMNEENAVSIKRCKSGSKTGSA